MNRTVTLTLSFLIVLTFCKQSYAQVYWKDVATIFYSNCSSCHREGEIGPFSLMSFKEVSNPDHIYSIESNINSGLMPPWKADPSYRHFLDERFLTTVEKELINEWIDNGAQAGDTTLAPAPPVFVPGSQIGIPDKIVSMSEPYYIPGDDSDHYMCFVLPTNFLNSQNVAAIEFRPGNAAVVHHSFIYLCDDSSAYYADQATPEYGYSSFGGLGDGVSADFLSLYGPGMTARYYPPGSGINFPVNSFVVIQIHYAPVSSPATDQSSINLFYAQQPEVRYVFAKKIGEGYITNPPFKMLANKRDTFFMKYPINKDYSLFGIAPHQHLIGESFMIWAVTPQGDSIPLVNVPKWDFHWQLLYNYPFMIKLPEGTIVYARACYDNTIYNPNNPHNPPEDIHYGESSADEMCKFLLNMLEYEPGDENIVLDSNFVATNTAPIAGIVNTAQLYACFPNPAQNTATIPYYLPKDEQVTFYFNDVKGNLIDLLNSSGMTGFNQSSVDVGDYANGIYFITMKTANKEITKQLIIQH